MSDALSGKRVLVVEDESLVAMLLETILEDVGCTPVGPASTVDAALAAVADEALDSWTSMSRAGRSFRWPRP